MCKTEKIYVPKKLYYPNEKNCIEKFKFLHIPVSIY